MNTFSWRHRGRRAAGLAAATCLGLSLAACGLGDDGPGDGPEDPSTSSSYTPSGDAPTELPPQLQDCAKGDGKETPSADGDEDQPETHTLADVDLTTARWDMPDGFQEASGYYEDNPFEPTQESIWYAEVASSPEPLNVINVVVYSGVDWGGDVDECQGVPWDAVEQRLARYREDIGAEPLSEPEEVTLAGYPAIMQDISLDKYDYHGYWLFSETQLLHLYCQWTVPQGQETEIRDGCEQLVSSLQVG